MLRKLSAITVRRPALVLVLWLAVVAAGFGYGIGVFDRLVGDVGVVPGSESQRADHRVERAAPRPEAITAVVSGRPVDDPAMLASVARAVADVRALPGVAEVADPMPSTTTGRALLLRVALTPGEGTDAAAAAAADRLARIEAPVVTVGGGPLQGAETDGQAQSDVARAELVTLPLVLILLLLVFGSLLAAGLPLLVAVAGIGTTFLILRLFSMVTDVSVYAIQLTTTLAVGLAVDYALLIVSRFREERRTTADVATAVVATVASAGRTVVFSGLVVAVALAGLVVFPDPFLRSMGLAAATVVAVDMLVAITLVPALLVLFGRRIRPSRPRAGGGAFAAVARVVQRRPLVLLIVTAAAMTTLALPVLGLRISEGDARMMPAGSQTRELWDQLATHFAEQVTDDRVFVVADTNADDPAVQRLRGAIAGLATVARADLRQVASGLTLIEVTSAVPPESPAWQATVTKMRAMETPFAMSVTDGAAQLADYRTMLRERLPWAIGLVVVGTLLLLFALTGSLVLPVKAVLTNLLSIGAALGTVVWVFQDGHLAGVLGTEGLGYVHLTVPVLIGAIAFGLSMDYEVFLLARIRERWLGGATPHDAVAEGLQRTGGIVTSAALVLGVVFAGFLIGGFVPIKSVGLGLMVAIVLDVTIVRMLMVPATMTLLGTRNWWLPRPLRVVHAKLTAGAVDAERPPAVDVPEREPVGIG